jgi:F-type H+-transporting ATPase subunit b
MVLASEEGGGGGGGLTVIPDWTTWVQMANFIILIWVLNLILYRPIRNVLLKRKDKISGLEQSIEAATKDVQDKEAAYASGIKEARARGIEQKEKLVEAAAEEERNIIAEINEKAQVELAKVRDQVAREADEARSSLMQQVDGFAEAIGQKILGRAIS